VVVWCCDGVMTTSPDVVSHVNQGVDACPVVRRHLSDAPTSWCYSDVTVVLQWCYNGVTVLIEWCSSGGTIMVQWCYIGVTIVLQ
jgi:hypothetical protein